MVALELLVDVDVCGAFTGDSICRGTGTPTSLLALTGLAEVLHVCLPITPLNFGVTSPFVVGPIKGACKNKEPQLYMYVQNSKIAPCQP